MKRIGKHLLLFIFFAGQLNFCKNEEPLITNPGGSRQLASYTPMKITTYPCSNGNQLDTFVELYYLPGMPNSQIIQKDDNSGFASFSQINADLLEGATVYIHVQNGFSNDTGCYGIYVSRSTAQFTPTISANLVTGDTGDRFDAWNNAAPLVLEQDTVHYDDGLNSDWFYFTVPGDSGTLNIVTENATVMSGYAAQFTALYTAPNGNVTDVTSQVAWSSYDPFSADFSREAGREGLLETQKSGNVQVVAQYFSGSLVSNAASIQINDATTPGDLIISEVGEKNWIELYNRGATPANLSLYKLKTPVIKYDSTGASLINAPPISLSASGVAGVMDEVMFCYEKDSYLNAGMDRVWIDNIQISGANPAVYDFTGNQIPANLVNDSGGNQWVVDSSTGNPRLMSGQPGPSSGSCFTLLVDGGSSITYSYITDTENNYDFLRVYQNRLLKHEWAGFSGSWKNSGPVALTGGSDLVTWCYEKNAAANLGRDSVWVDNINVTGVVGANTNPIYTFEDGLYPSDFTPDPGGASWSVGNDGSGTGWKTIRSGPAAQLGSSCFSMTVTNGASLSFDYMLDTQTGHYLRVYVNNVSVLAWTGQGYSYIYDYAGVTMNLPPVTVPPGGFVVIEAASQSRYFTYDPWTSPGLVVFRDATGYYPNNTASGFVELSQGGTVVDFTVYGSSVVSPTDPAQWSGAASAGPAAGGSLARDGLMSDTNAPADWSVQNITTKSGPNDVLCNTDADGDLIPDCSEVAGSTFMGMPLYDWGARANQKDIFIEIDYMGDQNSGPIPYLETINWIKAKFLSKGYTVHIDAGDMFDQNAGLSPANFDLGGGESVPSFSYAYCGSSGQANISTSPNYQVANLRYFRDTFMAPERHSFFVYALYANSSPPDRAFGGITCGNYFMLNAPSTGHGDHYNMQLNIFFHEFGHVLGLGHGGGNSKNYKPNYVSSMNYLYSYTFLPVMGSPSEAYYYYAQSGCFSALTGLSSGTLEFDYSTGLNPPIDENNILESNGISGGVFVDYNCNGLVNDGYAKDLNHDGALDVLNDHDDWAAIGLKFSSRAFLAASGNYVYRLPTDEKIIYEEPPALLKERSIQSGLIPGNQ